jgi:diaminohydroxyphosphoribosylaminopyrimidine deaminase/5-amino-6-(5-phosphoribosylamino)uracil reductase
MDPLQPDDWQDEGLWAAVLAVAEGGQPQDALAASRLWRVYGPLAKAVAEDRPCVVGQIGQTLDGRIATATGMSRYINGPSAIVHLHRLRALVDAVIVGVGTAIADDPQLTVRHVAGRHPARVVIDPTGRMPDESKVLGNDGVRRIVIQAGNHPRPPGVETVRLSARGGVIDPLKVVEALSALGLRRILVEGGGVTVSQFLEAGCLDRLHVLVAPMIIGSGPLGIRLHEIPDLESAVRPRVTLSPFPEGDVLFDCDLTAREER